jgi:hypothetical protein
VKRFFVLLLLTAACSNNNPAVSTLTVFPLVCLPEESLMSAPAENLGLEETPYFPVLPRTDRVRYLQLALAQLCVSESMFQARTLDCRLIYEVMRYWSPGDILTMRAMRRYSRLTYDRTRTDPRRWIAFLNHGFTEPEGWSEDQTVPWSAVRGDFQRVYDYAGYLIRFPQAYPCTTQIHHWGARGFRRREHLREGWILVDCGSGEEETMNDFWTMPSRNNPETNVCYAGERICEI